MAEWDHSARWVGLFSGGKDSSWAVYRALAAGLPLERLLTVHPTGESYMYHRPATELAAPAARSIGIELEELRPGAFEPEGDRSESVGERGDRELEPVERALERMADTEPIAGITAGAIESEYQTSRIRAMADRLGCQLFAPLWERDPRTLAEEMIDAGFDIRIVQVAAAGLDASWLGRRLDRSALAELATLNEAYGVHLMGEGGEFETVVVDGPHMDRRLELESEPVWQGDRGHLEITEATLAD